jgi:predicted nucleic acid-binding protein
VDSSALVSLLNPLDSNHAQASAIAAALTTLATGESLLVPSEVVSETLNIVGKKLGHDVAVAMGWHILKTGAFIVGSSAPEMLSDALKQFAEQPGGVSFTDCLVMQWAHFYDTRFVFGFDQVFSANGYRLPPVLPVSRA